MISFILFVSIRKIRVLKHYKSSKSSTAQSGNLSKEEAIGKSEAPLQSLELNYVHGYRGYDCRDNLFYSSRGEIIYHIAALGIVYDKSEKKQRFYTKHTDDILCLDIHPSRLIVATGQIGAIPSIHIWDTDTMCTLSIIQVRAIHFSVFPISCILFLFFCCIHILNLMIYTFYIIL